MEVFLIDSKDFIILIWGLIRLIPNLIHSPRSITGNKEEVGLLMMDGKGHIRKESTALMRVDEPLDLSH